MLTDWVPVPLFCSTTVPIRPEIVPPTVNALAAHITAMLVTLEEPTTPDPWPTVHVPPAGCVFTLTT